MSDNPTSKCTHNTSYLVKNGHTAVAIIVIFEAIMVFVVAAVVDVLQ